MSTRSRIAVQQKNGGYESVYCHFDGYPHGLGITLNNFFPTRLDAHTLVAQGDISTIDFDSGAVNFYQNRSQWDEHNEPDEAWDNVKPIQSKNLDELLKLADSTMGGYVYIYYYGGNGPVCYNSEGAEMYKEKAIPTNRKAA